eukprot:5464477-Amphidinium_carterae.2
MPHCMQRFVPPHLCPQPLLNTRMTDRCTSAQFQPHLDVSVRHATNNLAHFHNSSPRRNRYGSTFIIDILDFRSHPVWNKTYHSKKCLAMHGLVPAPSLLQKDLQELPWKTGIAWNAWVQSYVTSHKYPAIQAVFQAVFQAELPNMLWRTTIRTVNDRIDQLWLESIATTVYS